MKVVTGVLVAMIRGYSTRKIFRATLTITIRIPTAWLVTLIRGAVLTVMTSHTQAIYPICCLPSQMNSVSSVMKQANYRKEILMVS